MKISIITATFNSARTVRDTFESILRQSCQDYEVIVVDGGSTDGTVEIIREYEPEFNGRLRWTSEPDKGLYDAMNKGIDRASGDVVGILNSDDFYTSDDVLQAVENAFLDCSGLDAVYGDVHYVSENDVTRQVRYYSSRVFRRPLMRFGFMPAHPSFYCRRSVFDCNKLDGAAIPGFKGDQSIAYFNTTYKVAADFEILLRMIYIGKIKTQYIRKDFVTMRIGGASTSGAASHMQINRDHLRALRENGIYSNIFLLGFRYLYKLGELARSKFPHQKSA